MKQNLLLAHGCGVGKTLEALHLMAFHPKPCLVICPASIVLDVWVKEIEKWFPTWESAILWGQTPAKRRKILCEKHNIIITSYNIAYSMYKDIVKYGFKCVILDESSQIRNPRSQRAALALALAGQHARGSSLIPMNPPIPHRYALSGTPDPNERYDYWTQVKFVAGEKHGPHPNFYRFREKYYTEFMPAQNVRIFRFKTHLLNEFQTEIAPWVDSVRTEDVLPELQSFEQIRRVKLSAAERSAYDSMERDCVIQQGDLEMLSKNTLTLVGHLRQLTSGFIYPPKDEAPKVFGTSKLDELDNLLAEIGNNRTIIWYNYDYEKEAILRRVRHSVWAGELKNRNRILTDFEIGRHQYLVANPASLGLGVNLQFVHHAIFFSLSPSYEAYEQARRRILRGGQREVCAFYFIMADNSYDQTLWTIIQRKQDASVATLEYLKGRK